jgi:hypothetical protein
VVSMSMKRHSTSTGLVSPIDAALEICGAVVGSTRRQNLDQRARALDARHSKS